MILKENKQALYFNMILGTIGTVLIPLAALRYFAIVDDFTGYTITLFGFLLTMAYIGHLEMRAGISKKLTRCRIIVSMILFFSISYFLFIRGSLV